MQCVDCNYMYCIKNSDGDMVDICVCADSGAYLEETGVCGNCSWDGYESLPTYYHVTLLKNVPSIRQNGLTPQVGERAASCDEKEPAIYLFLNKEDMEGALQNWLGEQFDEDADLAILELRLPLSYEGDFINDINVGYEARCISAVPEDYIQFFSEDGEVLAK